MRTIEEIKKDIETISEMEECNGRLGYAIERSFEGMGGGYEDAGKYLLRFARQNPEYLPIIDETVSAITGWTFNTLIKKMKEQKDDYMAL